MTIDFPPNPSSPGAPTPGQIFTDPGGAGSWQWDGVKWSVYSGPAGASVTVSDTAPSSPSNGNLWFNSSAGVGQLFIYYADPNTSQWVITCNLGGGQYLPLSGGVTTGPITHQNAGVLIGNAGTVPGQGALVLNANAAASPAPSRPGLQVAASDATNATVEVDGFGNFPSFLGRNTGGTNAAKTAIAQGSNLLYIDAAGYDGASYSPPQVRLQFRTEEAWTPTAHGSSLTIFTTPVGSVTPVNMASFGYAQAGGVSGGCQFQGTQTNDNAQAGWVGEYLSAINSGGTAMVSANAVNLTSLTLTPGDWDVSGTVNMQGTAPAMNDALGSISLTSGAAGPFQNNNEYYGGSTNLQGYVGAVPVVRISVAVSTPVYLVGRASFSSGTVTGYAFLQARRRR